MKKFRFVLPGGQLLGLSLLTLTLALATRLHGQSSVPPVVNLVNPTNGQVFVAPANIPLAAVVSLVPGTTVTNVEFFAGTNDLGSGVPGLLPPPQSPAGTPARYTLDWTKVPAGSYSLTAVAMAAGGNSTTSAPVNITVLPVLGVTIIQPTNGQQFLTPVDITLVARVTNPGDSVSNVEFFAGNTDLGPGVSVVLDPPPPQAPVGSPSGGLVYILTWTGVPANHYALTAVVTAVSGRTATSAPVNITVLSVTHTNLPPIVRMVSPANGAVFHAPVNVLLVAFAHDLDGSVTSVEFFEASNSLGFGHRLPLPTPLAGPPTTSAAIIFPTNLFFLDWSNAPAGVHALTAKATDNDGAATVSAPVNIVILPPVPPPTNRPPIVNIVATDPVAIEGTNSWVWTGESNLPPTWAAWPTATARFFTNFGPRTATFTVSRFGDTNGDLTVPYDIGGTASDGVDYVTLPGFVTIPSGERHALITIVPIDDGPPDINKTVILALTPSTNAPPDYLLGIPRKAAAIILDGVSPRPVSGPLAGQGFHFVSPGPDAAWFRIEYSTDLNNWTPACTNQVINGSIDYIDPDAAANPSRFYRAVPLAGPPTE